MKTIKINNLELGIGRPKVCIPLIGSSTSELLEEAANAMASEADLVEWRIDFFDSTSEITELERTGRMLRDILESVPLLITFRTKDEGGAKSIDTLSYEKVLGEICERKIAHMIDVEMMKGDETAKRLIAKAREYGVITIGSNHDFEKTPSKGEIIRRLCKMQELGFDMTKIAVMPRKERDVLDLLDATLAMKETFGDRPFVTMSMGKIGIISRMTGECFGSSLTFGTAGAASAPGQIDAKELKQILHILHDDNM